MDGLTGPAGVGGGWGSVSSSGQDVQYSTVLVEKGIKELKTRTRLNKSKIGWIKNGLRRKKRNAGEKKQMSKAIGKDGQRQQRLVREGVKMCVRARQEERQI